MAKTTSVLRSEFLDIFEKLAKRHHAWEVWKDFVVLTACSISNAMDKTHFDEREALYIKTIERYSVEERNLILQLLTYTVLALEENPDQDFLGSLFMDLKLGDDRNGQLFTPYHVCKLMSESLMHDTVKIIKDRGYITIGDPCCGAGAMLIAAVNTAKECLQKEKLNFQNHILITAQDIDMIAALMCYIQLSLLGVAAYVKIGNSLTDPISERDSLDNYWFTPMYYSRVWVLRRVFHSL